MIKYLEGLEKIESRNLYEEVFNDSKEFTDYYFNEHAGNNKILGYFEKSELISMMHLKQNHFLVKGKDAYFCYVFAVATKLEYRRKGYMEGVMEKALLDLHNQGMPLCYLIPEKSKTYYKFEFQTVRDGSEKLANTAKMEYDVCDFLLQEASEKHFDKLIKFALDNIKATSEFFKARNLEYYQDMMKHLKSENGCIRLIFHKSDLKGYAYVSNENGVIISEIICNKDYEEVFLKLIGSKYKTDKILIKTPPLMIRILSPEFMANYLSSEENIEINIKLTDSIIEANNQIFNLKSNNSGSTISITDNTPDCEMSISDFTAWIFGYKEYPQLPRLNVIKGIMVNEIL